MTLQEIIDRINTKVKRLEQTVAGNEQKNTGATIPVNVILKSCSILIELNEKLINKYGFRSYLKENVNVYFLVDSIEKNDYFTSSYYTQYPAVKYENSFDNVCDEIAAEKSLEIIDKLCSTTNTELRHIYLSKLPIQFREQLLEIAIDERENSKITGEKLNEFTEWYLEFHKNNIHTVQSTSGGQIVSSLYEGGLICRTVDEYGDTEWIDCSNDENIRFEIETGKKKVVDELKINPYGYYAIVNPELFAGKDGWKHGFWIRDLSKVENVIKKSSQKSVQKSLKVLYTDIDKRKLVRGEKCSTGSLKKGKLATMTFTFGLDVDSKTDVKVSTTEIRNLLNKDNYLEISVNSLTDKELRRLYRLYKLTGEKACSLLYTWFKANNLIEYTTAEEMK